MKNQDKKGNLLQEWLDEKYLKTGNTKKLIVMFSRNKPFPFLELNDFLKAEKAAGVLKALSGEKFHEKESDLFKFMQTDDLNNTSSRELQEFRDFLYSKEFVGYMDQLTGFRLKTDAIDLAGTLYQDTDYLLCHDDRLEGRKIAYLFYLSDMEEKDGGSLNLFASKSEVPVKIGKKIIPRFNTFAFFEVSPISFHEVEEVIAQKQRIAIGGWFYGR